MRNQNWRETRDLLQFNRLTRARIDDIRNSHREIVRHLLALYGVRLTHIAPSLLLQEAAAEIEQRITTPGRVLPENLTFALAQAVAEDVRRGRSRY